MSVPTPLARPRAPGAPPRRPSPAATDADVGAGTDVDVVADDGVRDDVHVGTAAGAIGETALRASLSAERRRELARRSDRAGAVQLAGHAAAVAFTGTWIALRWPFWPAAMLVHGTLLVFLFTAMHECAHRTAFAARRANDAATAACGAVLGLSAEWFRHFHFAHHRHVQEPDRDPELATPRPRTRLEYLVHVSGWPTWRAAIAGLLRNGFGRGRDPYVPARAQDRVRFECRALLALYASVAALSAATGSTAALTLWVVPMLLGQPLLRLYLLAEHGRCPFVADRLVNTRTTFTNALLRKLAWNMPYHAEHHAFPAVPFHRLPELHAIARDHLGTTSAGYVRFSAGYARGMRAGERARGMTRGGRCEGGDVRGHGG